MGLESTTTTGCALGVQHPCTGKLDAQRCELRLLPNDCWTALHSLVKGNTKVMKPETVTRPSGSLLLTLWTFVFADDMRRKRCSLSTQLLLAQETMIVRWKCMVKRPTNQPRRNREVILSRCRQSQISPRTSWNFVIRHPAEHTQQLRTLFTRGTGSDVAAERSQATHSPTCTRFCLSITSRNSASTSSLSDKFGSHAS